MNDDTVVQSQPEGVPPPNPWTRWWLPLLLGLLIVAIVFGAYFASHPHMFGGGATSTPTATATPRPTATPKPTAKALPTATSAGAAAPTATSKPAATPKPTATPHPVTKPTATAAPRSTPTPAATSTPTGVQTGQFSMSSTQERSIQQGANQGNSADTPYLDPFKALQKQIAAYGFTGTVKVVQPAPEPSPTPTSYAGANNYPSIKFTLQYQGKQYTVVLNQPVQQGPKGIWILYRITAM